VGGTCGVQDGGHRCGVIVFRARSPATGRRQQQQQ